MPQPATEPLPATFSTEDLPLAAYLHATRKLPFLRCERVNGGPRVAFLFHDPRGDGERLRVSFETGAECAAAAFYDAVRHLRRAMTSTTNTNTNQGARNYESGRRNLL